MVSSIEESAQKPPSYHSTGIYFVQDVRIITMILNSSKPEDKNGHFLISVVF